MAQAGIPYSNDFLVLFNNRENMADGEVASKFDGVCVCVIV